MFEHPEVKDVALLLSDGYVVEEGKEEGTWLISGVDASLVTTFGEPAVTDTSRTCATVYVRQAESGSYQIYREVTFGNADCTGWLGE